MREVRDRMEAAFGNEGAFVHGEIVCESNLTCQGFGKQKKHKQFCMCAKQVSERWSLSNIFERW